jgi:hypothetical protein
VLQTNLKMMRAACCLCQALALGLFFLATPAQGQTTRSNVRKLEPNVHAPHLYTDRIKLKLTLINLPGAEDAASYWEASYQIFFISEANFSRTLKAAPVGGWNPTPENFPGRILIGEGRIRRTSLRTLKDRTYLSRALVLKAKVPDQARTKYARILTSYSVKIYDGRLKSNIIRSGVFMTDPFTGDAGAGETVEARKMLYANFYVGPTGQLSYSQRPRNSEDTNWP